MVGYETKENLLNKTKELVNKIIELEYLCLDCLCHQETDKLAREIKKVLGEASESLLKIQQSYKNEK